MVFSLRAMLLPFSSLFALCSVLIPPDFALAESERISHSDPRSPASWEYHSTEGALCRDGSEAAYYLKREVFDKRLLIYLAGGGACFNPLTCSQNPSRVGDQFPDNAGIFAEREDNPFRDFNVMYVPYCTGDVFVGSRSDVRVPGVNGVQQFVGRLNLEKFLDQVQKQLPDLELVVLSGSSAGGFGTIFQMPKVVERWPDTPVTMLNDSGVPLEDEYLRPCLQAQIRELWNLDAILPQDCSDCRDPDGGGLTAMINYVRERYGVRQHGMVLSMRDMVLRLFFGFSLNECRPLVPYMSGERYEEGIRSLKTNFLQGSIKSFIVPGETHTFIAENRFYSSSLEGQSLASWVGDLLAQKARDRGVKGR